MEVEDDEGACAGRRWSADDGGGATLEERLCKLVWSWAACGTEMPALALAEMRRCR